MPNENGNGINGKFTDVHMSVMIAPALLRNAQERQPEHDGWEVPMGERQQRLDGKTWMIDNLIKWSLKQSFKEGEYVLFLLFRLFLPNCCLLPQVWFFALLSSFYRLNYVWVLSSINLSIVGLLDLGGWIDWWHRVLRYFFHHVLQRINVLILLLQAHLCIV